ncbi:MAG: hydroxyisourate hydrolase [Myxococcales bacterium]|nr:hydroxyisourate hydrolase [Myxococcales bacterium]
MSPLTTHVLDTAHGTPAAGVGVTLSEDVGGAWRDVSTRQTNADGRVPDLLPESGLHAGRWRLRFDVAPYFAARGLGCFFPYAELVFDVTDLSRHHHIPLLVSPFSYSTYRGS